MIEGGILLVLYKNQSQRQCSKRVSEWFSAARKHGTLNLQGLESHRPWKFCTLKSLNPSCSDCLEELSQASQWNYFRTVICVVSVTPARNYKKPSLCVYMFSLRENYFCVFQHSLSEDIEFALFSCHGTADCDKNYLNWTNWLLHSSSRSLCGQSLDVHCQLERINRKT